MKHFANCLIMAILILLSVNLFAQQNVSAPQKFALVIGNGNYANFGTLRNPVNDANDMAETLQSLGFTVDKVIDGNRVQINKAVERLKNNLTKSGNNAYGFFYYAGHGVQVDGVNYLIPSNADIPDKDYLPELAVSVQVILNILNSSKNALNIVVLDACRDFPAAWNRSTDRGLGVMNPPTDSIIMYATAAGKTAADGTGKNGLFTEHLLKNLKSPGISVTDIFFRTMNDVAQASNNQQRPAMYTDFAKIAYLGTRPVSASAPVPYPVSTQVSQKYALVIGNGNYTSIAKLNHPVNDANDVAATLQSLGFTVDKVLDGNLDQMERAITQFKNRLSESKNTYGFFYYAGHGVQYDGVNYLLPSNANILDTSYLGVQAVSVRTMFDRLNEAENELNVVVLDACRDSPFVWSRSSNRGLSVVENLPANSIIVLSASAGSVAQDGSGRNSLFTDYLLNNLKTPGLEVTEVFNRTMSDVARASSGTQRPVMFKQFTGTAYLGLRPLSR